MTPACFVGVYMLVGLGVGWLLITLIAESIERYEAGEELDDNDAEGLDAIAKLNRVFGGKKTIFFICMYCMFLWLPLLLESVLKRIPNHFRKD